MTAQDLEAELVAAVQWAAARGALADEDEDTDDDADDDWDDDEEIPGTSPGASDPDARDDDEEGYDE